MPYIIYNSDGTVATSGGAASGGGGANKSVIWKGYLWPSSGNYPTAMTPHREAVTDSATTATVPQGDGMTGPGTVVGLSAYIYGSSGGGANNYTWTLYKNGVATGLTCTFSSTAAAAGIASNTTVPFVAGDVLQVWSSAVSGATPQATKASITVTLT